MNCRGRRGSVLMQVLVGAVICAYIIVLILRFQMQSGLFGANLVDSVAKDKQAESSLNLVQTAWNSRGSTCTSLVSAGVSCGGGGCRCTCTVVGLPSVQSVPGIGGSCNLTVIAP